jgi:hypothetical protein
LRIQDLQAEAINIEGNPKVKVLVEKVVTPFTQNKLTVTDTKNTKRFATAGKTLYFINKPIKSDYKEIKLEATLSQTDNNQIPKENIKWKINDIENEYKEGYTEFTIPITDKIKNATFTNSAGFPTMTDKTVSVKWVDEGILKIDIGNKLGPILKIFDEINYWQNKFKLFGIPCKVAVLENLERAKQIGKFSFSYEKKNEEDNKSRYYNKVDKFKFSASGAEMFNLSCGKDVEITIPFTSKKIPIVNANFGVSAGLKGNIEIIKEAQIETNKISYNKSKVSGGGYVTPFISASIVGVQGKVDMETGIRFEYPYKSNPVQVGVIFYTSDITGKVEISKDVSVFVTESFSYQLFRLDTKKEIEVFKLDINTLTE